MKPMRDMHNITHSYIIFIFEKYTFLFLLRTVKNRLYEIFKNLIFLYEINILFFFSFVSRFFCFIFAELNEV